MSFAPTTLVPAVSEERDHLRGEAGPSGALGMPTIFVDGVFHHGAYEPEELCRALAITGQAA
jgi:hypothetical protein